jgi:hypothetical protein
LGREPGHRAAVGITAATVVVIGVLLSTAKPAFAPEPGIPSGGGSVSGDAVLVGIVAPGQDGGNGAEPASTGGGSAPSPYRYTWLPPTTGGLAPIDPICVADSGVGGVPRTLVVQDLAGSIVNMEARCVPVGPTGPVLPPLPPVPTVEEIWRAALRQVPPPTIGINPRPTGLTGLETWLWYEGPAELQVSTSIGPWTVTGTARVQEVTFEMGEGRTARATSAGSEANPAARYVYERKGQYRIAATARWGADFVLTGPGLPPRPTPMGVAVLRSSEDYPVQEVRGLLVPDRRT